jgi:hypothetical protein
LNSSNKFACLCGRSNTTSVCHGKLFIAVWHIMENCALLATLQSFLNETSKSLRRPGSSQNPKTLKVICCFL